MTRKTKGRGAGRRAGVPLNEEFVKRQLDNLGLKGTDVVLLTGLSQTTVYRVLFKGGPWTDSTLARLSTALSCSPYELIADRVDDLPVELVVDG